MADDFLAQVRTLNPDLKDYDDQTLAAAIGDQHPDYKPKLAKYFPDTAENTKVEAPATAASAAADLEASRHTMKTAITQPPPWLTEAAGNVENPYLRGAAKFGASQVTLENAGLLKSLGMLPAKAAPVALEVFGAKGLADTLRSIPDLWAIYRREGLSDNLKEKMTSTGLGGLLSWAIAARGTSSGLAPEGQTASPPPADTSAGEAAVKGHQAVARALADVAPESARAATEAAARQKTVLSLSDASPELQQVIQENLDEWQDLPKDRKAKILLADQQKTALSDQMRPEEPPETTGPPIVKGAPKPVTGQSGQQVIPNEPANPVLTEGLKETLRDAGVDPDDPQAVATFLGQQANLSKPVNVTSVGDVDVSESSQTPHDYQLDLADGGADKVAHEIQHARQVEGQIPQVPEGPGANDQIVGQVAQDISPKYAEPTNINLNRLGISGGAKQEIINVADQLRRHEPIPWAQTAKDAAESGYGLSDIQKLAKATEELRTQVTSARMIEGTAAEQIYGVKDAVTARGEDWRTSPEVQKQVEGLVASMQAASDLAFNVAGAESSFNIVVSQLGDILNTIKKKGIGGQELKEMLLETDLRNPLNRQKLRQRLATKPVEGVSKEETLRSQVGGYWMSNILSGIPTAGIKASADLSTTLFSIPMETLGALAKDPMSPRAAIAQGQARAAGMAAAQTEALAAFGEAWRHGSAQFNRGLPFQGEGSMLGIPNAVMRKVTPPSFRVLGGINDMFHMFNERGELYAAGIRDAIEAGKPHEEWAAHAKEFADNPTQEALDHAIAEARKNTLTAPVGEWTKAILTLRGSIPGGFVAAPVVTVPTNLVKIGFEMTPFGAAKLVADAARGKPISNQAAGRAVLGSMVFAYAMKEAFEGKLHDSGPTDRNERAALLKTNWIPDAWEVDLPGLGKTQLPVKFLGPLAIDITLAANLAGVIKEAPRAPGLEKAVEAAWIHMGRTILDYPMLRGLSDLTEAFTNPRALARMAGGAVSGLVPWSSMLARTAAAMDPYQRKVSGFIDAIKSRIPFIREKVDPKYDYVGNPLPAPGSFGSRLAAPVSTADITTSPTQRLAATLHMGDNPTTIKMGEDELKLKDHDASEMEKMIGENVRETFDTLDKAPSQLLETDADGNPTAPAMIREVVKNAREHAKADMLARMTADGRMEDYVGKARVAAANKMQLDPYALDMSTTAARKAKDMLNRFGVGDAPMPAGLPPELASHYLKELQIARSTMFNHVINAPEEIGSQPFADGREAIKKLEKISEDFALRQTMNKANALKNAAPKAQNQGAEAP